VDRDKNDLLFYYYPLSTFGILPLLVVNGITVCTWCRYCAKTGLRNDFYANFLIEHISRHFLDEVSGPESVGVAGSDITRRAKWVTSVVWVLAHADHLAQIRTKIIHTKIALHLVGDLFERDKWIRYFPNPNLKDFRSNFVVYNFTRVRYRYKN
jgi:hypothetical protein